MWLINTHNGIREKGINRIKIEDYPAIKEHLDQYIFDLKKRSDKGETIYNLRNCAYMDDFSKQKIIYPDIMRMPRQEIMLNEYPYFYLDEGNFYVEATNFIMTGKDINIVYLYLASDFGFFIFSKFYAGPQFDATGFRYKKAYLDEIPIPNLNDKQMHILLSNIERLKNNEEVSSKINLIWYEIVGLNTEEIKFINQYKSDLLT